MSLITCQDVSFAYEGNTAVSGLNFKVQNGDYLCVVDENNSGKSTLIKGLLRLKVSHTGNVLMGDGCAFDLKPDYLPRAHIHAGM